MTLSPGSRLGAHEIVGMLGAGGPPPLARLSESRASSGEVSPKPR
jgi:hypothetical protein